MQFEADTARLMIEAEAVMDSRRKLNIIRASMEELQNRLSKEDTDDAAEYAVRLRILNERLEASSRMLGVLGKSLRKTARIYRDFDEAAAEMKGLNRWLVPVRDAADPGRMCLIPVFEGLSGEALAVPELIVTRKKTGLSNDVPGRVIRLSSAEKGQCNG